MTAWPSNARLEAGLAYIPADRGGTSLVQGMSVADNLALRDVARPPFSRYGWLDAAGARKLVDARTKRFGDSTDMCSLVNAKSGGCAEDCGFCG